MKKRTMDLNDSQFFDVNDSTSADWRSRIIAEIGVHTRQCKEHDY